jgi:hypothetical protein
MAKILGLETGLSLPSMASSTVGFYILLGLVFLVMVAIAGGVWWWYYQKRIYFNKIVVFENISGVGWQKSQNDTARHLRLSKDGTQLFWLRKNKMPLTAYGRKMGHNQYWFAIGPDGGWYNIVLGDLDSKMGILDIEPIDRDIKYVSVAMRKNAQENYGPKQTFMDKYGTWILGGITMIVFFIGAYFIVEQMGVVGRELSGALQGNQEVLRSLQGIVSHLDSICTGGSGITST